MRLQERGISCSGTVDNIETQQMVMHQLLFAELELPIAILAM